MERNEERVRTGEEGRGDMAVGEAEREEGSAKQAAELEERERPRGGSAFEGIYDRMPDISIRALDWFILACVIALVAVVLTGVLKANHVF